jgi:hypothetical protein
MTPAVLILSHPEDVHVRAVLPHLEATGAETFWTDIDAMGGDECPILLSIRQDVVTGQIGPLDIDRIVGVWHRRPSEFALENFEDQAEMTAGVNGVLASLPHLNCPADMATAAMKPYHLSLAARLGFAVPNTVISTALSDAVRMASEHEVLIKPMSRQVAGIVETGHYEGWDRVIHMTQERIKAASSIRVTVVDGFTFAAKIESPHLDWRREMEVATYSLAATPAPIIVKIQQLLDRLRLRFATVDFVVDTDDTWWFIEVNPNGQWLQIEEATELPISAAVAGALARQNVRNTSW